MEAIDDFKYVALLSKLESIKGTKKPIHDFIKELAELSNNFSSRSNEYKEQPLTQMYAFMLATRAMEYDGSVRPISLHLQQRIEWCVTNLLKSPLVNYSNAAEVFANWNKPIYFYPQNLDQLFKMDDIVGTINCKLYCFYRHVDVLEPFSHQHVVVYILLTKRNPNSSLAATITFDPAEYDKTIIELESFIKLYQGAQDEHNRTSSKTE